MRTFERNNFCDGVHYTNDGQKREAEGGISVRLTALCDNACGFCIAAEDMKHVRPVNIPKVIQVTKDSGARACHLIGGEPLLFLDNCLEYIYGVKDQLDYWFITTSLPYTLESQWDKFCELMRMTPSLAVSLQSTDWQVNNEILKAKKPFNRIELLEKIVNTEDFGSKVLVQLNLMKGGIDTAEKLWNALDDLNDIGVTNVRINELQKARDYFVSFEDITGTEMMSPYAHGCKTYMKGFYPGMSVLVKRSCFMVEESLTASQDDLDKMIEKVSDPEKYAWPPANFIYEDGSQEYYWLNAREEFETVNIPKETTVVSLGMPKVRSAE